MALKLGELQVDIGANTKGLDAAGKKVKNTAASMERSFGRLGGIIAGALSVEAVRRTLAIADSMRLLDVRIKNAVKSQDDFNKSRKRLIEISRETGSTLAENVKLFEALTLSAKELGASNPQILQLTESLNKLGVIGGSSGEAMKNSMRQLSQAMAGGIVRAEEFNSILENTPMVANAISEGLGISVGEMRKMVIEGKLLADDVFNSILGQTDEINKRFETIPVTIERASAAAATNFALVVAEINNGVDASETLAAKIQSFAGLLIEFPNHVRAAATILIGEFDRLFIRISSGFKIAGLEIEKFFTLVGPTGQLDEQIAAIKTVRDAQIQASKEAVEAGITEELRLLAVKRGDSDEAAGGAVASLPASVGGGKVVSKQEESQLERLRQLGETELEEIGRIAEERLAFLLTQDQLEGDERAKLQEKINDEKAKSIKESEDRMQALQERTNQTALNSIVQLGDQINSALEASGKEGTVIGKAIFLAQKGIQVASILAATEVAAANASAVAALGGPIPFFATQGAIRATGYASAGIVAGMAVGEAFEDGGIVGGSSFSGDRIQARVNSGEMILNKGQQSNLFNMANGGGSGGGGITIINEVSDIVTVEPVSLNEVRIIARQEGEAAENRVNASLSSGRGNSAQAVQKGFNMARNIN